MKPYLVALVTLFAAPGASAEEPTAPPVESPSAESSRAESPPPSQAHAASTAPPPVESPSAAPQSVQPAPAAVATAHRSASVKEADEANNPLATKASVNLQDYYVTGLSGLADSNANTAFLRVSTPFWRVLPRVSLPFQSISTPGSAVSGLGDLQAFANFVFTSPGSPIQLGAGPVYIAPTATDPALGTGKHQGGGSIVFVYNHPGLLLGSLLQYQLSFAGDSARADTESLTAQLFLIAQIGGGYYLRSAPTATFDVQNGNYNIPLGIGAGKVFLLGKVVTNFFIEPQYVLVYQGVGQPTFQVFSGINTQFAL
jgi:hypothetical protein